MAQSNCKKAMKAVSMADVTTVHDAPDKVVCLKDTNSLEYALSKLAANNIFSAPVFKPNGDCIGLLDCLDIVAAVMRMMDQATEARALNEGEHGDEAPQIYVKRSPEYWLDMAGKLALGITQTHDVLDMKDRDPYVALQLDDNPSLYDVSQLFSGGIHRCALVSEGKIVRVVSQSALIAHLVGNPDVMGELGNTTLETANLAPAVKVVKMPAHVAAGDAFRTLAAKSISGIAVIDDEGRLIGVLEASDLKRLTAAKMRDLTLPILEFLQDRRRGVKPAEWAFSAKHTDTIATTLKNFADHHVHRLFVTNAAGKPIGIVSFSDILCFLHGEQRVLGSACAAP